MQEIKIDLDLVARNATYTRNHQDKYDLSALIALGLSKQCISRGEKLLTDLKNPIHPLTTTIRNRIVLTPVGYQLLQWTMLLPKEQIAKANRLLAPHQISLIPEKGCGLPNRKPRVIEPEYDHNFEPSNFKPPF